MYLNYNILNLPKKITRGSDSISYIYSASGEKLVKRMKDNSCNYYAGSMVYNNDKTLKYILFEEGMVNKVSGGYTYEYHLKDHLGNTRVAFQPNGGGTTTTQVAEYYPFGSSYLPVSPAGTNKYLYNGKEKQDDELGNIVLNEYDYGARFYDPRIGRFHTQDRFAEKYMGLNPYHYAANNPIKFIDFKGDSVVVLQAPDGAGGAGHMAILIQNKKGKWSLWSKNGTNGSSGTSGPNDKKPGAQKGNDSFNSPEEFFKSDLNPVTDKKTGEREYTDGYLIPTTTEQDEKVEAGAKDELDKNYNVLGSNCVKAVQSALNNAGKKDGRPSFWSNARAAILGGVLAGQFGAAAAMTINEKPPNKIYERIKDQNQGTVVK